MASFEKVGRRWRAHVARNGVRQSKTFATKQEARDWAARVELEITGGAKASRVRFGDVLDRYGREVSPSKRGYRWEVMRIERFRKEPIADKPLAALDALDFAAWRAVRDRAGIVGLTFHDARHAAVTRLSRKLDVLALARMIGHRDIRMLQIYYNETAEEIAKRLD